ncbi:MAG: hypothetical protein ACP5GN_07460 [Fervidicoccaceae archaeon]
MGRTQLPAGVSRRSAVEDTSSLRIWGTHLRWAALCPRAWEIIISGRIPSSYTTPPIVSKEASVHDRMVKIIEEEWLNEKNSKVLYKEREPSIEYSMTFDNIGRKVTIVAKPDFYVLWEAEISRSEDRSNLVNLIIEVTMRSKSHIPKEWLAAEMLGAYLGNLRPTFSVLIRPEEERIEIKALPLSTHLEKSLESLFTRGPKREATPSLCYNCDLRAVCPEPLM